MIQYIFYILFVDCDIITLPAVVGKTSVSDVPFHLQPGIGKRDIGELLDPHSYLGYGAGIISLYHSAAA